MHYQISWAREKDAGKLGFIHSESWKAAYKGIIPDEYLRSITPEQREQHFRSAIANKEEETAVIEVDGQMIGFITLGRSRDEDLPSSYGELWGIYLLPEYWRQGIGALLFIWGQGELTSRGYSKVTLWVLEDNINARKFYEEMGFAFDGTAKEIELGRTLREIRYSKSL